MALLGASVRLAVCVLSCFSLERGSALPESLGASVLSQTTGLCRRLFSGAMWFPARERGLLGW